MNAVCRIHREVTPADGSWNMAVDEAMLEAAVESDYLAIRWYRWSEPTVSLGYFQDTTEADVPPHLAECPLVRRLTGGGAILHDREWTYSCVLPAGHPLLAETPLYLYHTFHDAIADVLNSHGVPVRSRGESLPFQEGQPFLCYSRGDTRDLLLGEHKIVGSAQRRRRGAVLQHGSVLLRQSALTPEYPGLLDLHGAPIDIDRMIDEITQRISRKLSVEGRVCQLPEEIQAAADRLRSDRYDSRSWNRRR